MAARIYKEPTTLFDIVLATDNKLDRTAKTSYIVNIGKKHLMEK